MGNNDRVWEIRDALGFEIGSITVADSARSALRRYEGEEGISIPESSITDTEYGCRVAAGEYRVRYVTEVTGKTAKAALASHRYHSR